MSLGISHLIKREQNYYSTSSQLDVKKHLRYLPLIYLFEIWNEIFHDPIITAAMVDRITHQSYVINMNGTSYRLQQSKKFLESE